MQTTPFGVGKQSVCIYKHPLGGGRWPPAPPLANARKELNSIANKTKMFCFRLSERDYLAIQNRAERVRLSMTAFITNAALGRPIVIIDGLNNFLKELKAIGRNLNQLTVLGNMGKLQVADLGEAKARLGAVFDAVIALTEGKS